MKLQDFVDLAIERSPRGLGKLPKPRAQALVRSVLQTIAAQIDGAGDGEAVKVPLIGAFKVKVSAATESKPAARRVAFRRKVAKGATKAGAAKARKNEPAEAATASE